MFVLIPCKSLSAGKSRLSACLDSKQRRGLCAFFLTRTIELAIAVTGVERVRVVTSDADAGAIAARHAIPTSADASGLNAALANAREEIARLALRPQRLMILPVDLGYATAEALADAAKLEPDVVINPDEHGRGTNFLLLSPRAERFRFCFGEESFSQHCLQARAAGLSLGVLDDPRLARDIDEPEQYIKWRRSTAFPRALRTAECVDSLAGQSAAT